MHPDEHLNWLEAEAAAFARVLATADLAAEIAACPGWTLAELGSHLGDIHRWAAGVVRDGQPSDKLNQAPADPSELPTWFVAGASELLKTLRDADPELPCWTMSPPAAARFWMRRQAHETSLHRWDAQASQGAPGELDPQLAADGIAEVVDMFFPRQVRLHRTPPLPRSLRIEITAGPAYVLAGDGSSPQSELDCDATVQGDAEALLLLVWNRIGLDDPRITVSGDRDSARTVLEAKITP